MKISIIDNEFYVFRNGRTLTMTVIKMLTGKLVRSDTGFLGDKAVPTDIQKAIRKVGSNDL